MSPITCPVCGSVAVDDMPRSEVIAIPYGPDASMVLHVFSCRACGESGDFANANDEVIENALREAEKQSVSLMIDDLGDRGLSMAYLERALDLPQRTLARWKSSGCSASGTTLLRMVRTYPWLTKVAESGYSPAEAQQSLVGEAVAVFSRLADSNRIRCTASVIGASANEISVFAQIKRDAPPSVPPASKLGGHFTMVEIGQ